MRRFFGIKRFCLLWGHHKKQKRTGLQELDTAASATRGSTLELNDFSLISYRMCFAGLAASRARWDGRASHAREAGWPCRPMAHHVREKFRDRICVACAFREST